VDAARAEGQVAVALPAGAGFRDVAAAFQKRYPQIVVEAQGFSGRDFEPKLVQEHQAGQYVWDVRIAGADSSMQLVQANAIAPLPRDLPETTPGAQDDKWRRGFDAGFMDEATTYVYASAGNRQSSFFVNWDFVSRAALTQPEDVLKPEFKGKITAQDPRVAGAGSIAAAVLVRARGEDFLRRFLQQDVVATTDLRQLTEWVVRGRYPIALGLRPADLVPYQEQGLGMNVTALDFPDLLVETGGSGNVALVNYAPHPNAARLFLDWFFSRDGQTVWVTETSINSRRLDVPVGDKDTYLDPAATYWHSNHETSQPFRLKAMDVARELLR
jgi:iron(III) transport system substrate-binding protein